MSTGWPRALRPESVEGFLDALTPLLVRGFRESLYAALQPECPIRLSDGTYPLLTALTSGPASATTVATRVGVDRTVITKQATVLESAGVLARRPDPDDARATLLELTGAGMEVAHRLRRAALSLIAGLASDGIDDDTLTAATQVLVALRAGN